MKRIFLGAVLSLFAMVQTFADDEFTVDGIKYGTLGNNCEVIGNSGISGSIVIPETVTYQEKTYTVTNIGYHAFDGCSGLTSVTIPNSVTSVGDFAFAACSGLTSVAIGNSVTSIGRSAFNGCSGLTSVTIPNSVTSVGDFAFWRCRGLTSVTIPNSVTSVGDYAFAACSGLTSIEIPNSVTSIGIGAFSFCSSLTSLKVYIDSPVSVSVTDYNYTFNGVNKSKCVLYVPKGSLEAYKSAPIWQKFPNIVEMDKETAAKSALADSDIRVFAKGRSIIVNGAPEGAPVKVSGTNGVTLRNATGNGTITMDTKGIYFVTVGDQTFKVWL